jgi:hypothetical protein
MVWGGKKKGLAYRVEKGQPFQVHGREGLILWDGRLLRQKAHKDVLPSF